MNLYKLFAYISNILLNHETEDKLKADTGGQNDDVQSFKIRTI